MVQDPTHAMLVTMVAAVWVGVMLMVIARRMNVPSVVLLLAGGMALGPQGVGIVQPESLGSGLRVLVAIAVGLILFEGGLTLDLRGYRSAPRMIKRLLSIGVVTTWLGTALILWSFAGLSRDYAVIAGSLVIVTGPTVIAPLLKRIRIESRLHSILLWEGVLIDPIGVFVAVLCFEWIGEQSGEAAFLNLALRLGVGLSVGITSALAMAAAVQRKLVTEDMVNPFMLASALFVFGLADAMRSEAGLLAVTVAGFVFGIRAPTGLKRIRAFKAELTDLLIATLFILLSARLSFDQFGEFGVAGFVSVALVIFVVRPVAIALCSIGTDLNWRQKTFLGWVAPRGIVAASMASLFALRLEDLGVVEHPKFVETFTYSVIIGTVVLQGWPAGWLARRLGLERPEPTGWLIIGAHAFGRRLAAFIQGSGKQSVVLVDSNARAVQEAKDAGLTAIVADAHDVSLAEQEAFSGVGNVLALTDNDDLNVRICQLWGSEVVGLDHAYRCQPSSRAPTDPENELHGRLVWPRLPRPSLVSAELMRGEATAIEGVESGAVVTGIATEIATVVDGAVVLGSAPEGETPSGRLFLRREADYLVRALHPQLVLDLDVTDMATVFEKLMVPIGELCPELPGDTLVAELLERERVFPTMLGHGVAAPHAYSSALSERLCAIVRLSSGLDVETLDGEPVRLVFLLLSPTGDPEGHLATLADIARLVMEAPNRARLMSASSADEVLRIVQNASAP